MVNVWVGNLFTSEIAGDPTRVSDPVRRVGVATAQLPVWLAKDFDVLVLPGKPDADFVDYVTGLTGTDSATLRIVIPPAGIAGPEMLTADRLADPDFRRELRAVLAERPPERIASLIPDSAVAELAADLGYADAVAGHAFLSQGGGRLLNSKGAFRAVAAGAGVPIPEGGVVTTKDDAARLIAGLFAGGRPAILKRDFAGGGEGNEIVTAAPLEHAHGAQRLCQLDGGSAIAGYLDERWEWLTNGFRFPVVVEEYKPGSRAIFAEFQIGDTGPVYEENGEMFYLPLASSQIIPMKNVPQRALAELVNAGTRLCQALHAMGYRGPVGADAILTEENEVLYTEANGRFTGSTHLYKIIGRQVVGPAFGVTRVAVEYCDWVVPSFAEARQRLTSSGLAYDPTSQTGVVLVKAYCEVSGTVRYCAIADSRDAALEIRARVSALFDASSKKVGD
ncbi:preATP grasp domain-containing protein [Streptomyces sp. NPDC055107]